MFGRLILGVGWLTVVIYVANGVLGFLGGLGVWIQRSHLTGGLAATLLVVFVHSWFLLYLRGIEKILGDDPSGVELGRGRRAALAVLAAGAMNFLVSTATLAAEVPAWLHLAVVVLTLAVQVVALVLESRSVEAAKLGLDRARRGGA